MSPNLTVSSPALTLYTAPTPNGHKISIALEELALPYQVRRVDLGKGEQRDPAFVAISPNSKIPALVDGDVAIFESIAILQYLAEKTGKLLPLDPQGRYRTLGWCLVQASSIGPMMGQVGHFAVFAKEKIPYAIDRYTQEVNRLFGVMNSQLAQTEYLAGDSYTIADIATWPWLRGWQGFYKMPIPEAEFPHVLRWYRAIAERPAVVRGLAVPG